MLDGKKYGAILADPPWPSKIGGPKSPNKKYSIMSLKGIIQMPIEKLHDHSLLFLWTNGMHLHQAMRVIEAWGFSYIGVAFTWVKTTKDGTRDAIGPGFWTRQASEFVLLGKSGKPKRLSGGVHQVILEPRREHSRKPDCVYDRIEQLVDGPYLELFARQRRAGWDAWGNETEKFK